MNSIPSQYLFFVDLSTHSTEKRRTTISSINDKIEQLRKSSPKSHISIFQFDGKQLQCCSYSVIISDQPPLYLRNVAATPGPVIDAIGACIGTWRAFSASPKRPLKISMHLFSSIKDTGSTKYSVCSLQALFESLKKENWHIELHSINPLATQIASTLKISLASHPKQNNSKNQFLLSQLKRQWISQQKSHGGERNHMDYAA